MLVLNPVLPSLNPDWGTGVSSKQLAIALGVLLPVLVVAVAINIWIQCWVPRRWAGAREQREALRLRVAAHRTRRPSDVEFATYSNVSASAPPRLPPRAHLHATPRTPYLSNRNLPHHQQNNKDNRANMARSSSEEAAHALDSLESLAMDVAALSGRNSTKVSLATEDEMQRLP
ncbi:hypothetical protein R3P38DRAFT_3226553 [Favolaschia claudopus]|uniref:Uncharacterized protein n=1 Tax=Favolaschia claudopus TaxID=2862362 RepID=A0AAV9ZTI8_9AGAR